MIHIWHRDDDFKYQSKNTTKENLLMMMRRRRKWFRYRMNNEVLN